MITRTLTPQQFSRIKTALQAEYGVTVEGNQGRATLERVTAQMHFDGTTLTVEVVDKPYLMPKTVCESVINGWLDHHLG